MRQKQKRQQKRDKVYLSGPISSLPLPEARRRFLEAERRMQREGWRTANPLRMRLPVWLALHGGGKRWGYPLCLALELLWLALTADAILMLHGWQQSGGARAEHALAKALGIIVLTERNDSERKPRRRKRKDGKDTTTRSAPTGTLATEGTQE